MSEYILRKDGNNIAMSVIYSNSYCFPSGENIQIVRFNKDVLRWLKINIDSIIDFESSDYHQWAKRKCTGYSL